MALKKLDLVALVVALLVGVSIVSCQSQSSPAPGASASTPAAAPAPAPAAPAAAPAAPTVAAPSVPTAPAPTPTSAATAAPTPTTEVLKVGISVALSGVATRSGMTKDRFIRMGIDDVNAKGGIKIGNKIYKLEAVTVDDKGTADGGREAANRLVLAEKVRFILGTISTPLSGAQPITEPSKVMSLAGTAQDKSLGPKFPYTFQVGQSHSIMRAGAIFDWLTQEHPTVKRVAAIVSDDTAGRSIADAGEVLGKARGIVMVSKDFYPNDIKDFGPLVTRVLRQNPDGLFTIAGGRGPLFVDMMKQLYTQEYMGQVFGTSADESALRDAAAFTRNFTGALMSDWRAPVIGAMEKEIIQRAHQKYGESEIEAYQVGNYNNALLLAQALENAGTVDDADKIAKVLREGEWDTIWTKQWGKSKFVGAMTFGSAAQIEQPIYLSKSEGGKISTFKALKGTMD